MRKLSVTICSIMLILFRGIAFADPQTIELSVDQRLELNTFFSNFAEAGVGPFSNGEISDDQLIRFGLMHILFNRHEEVASMRKQNGGIPSEEIDNIAEKYFGRVVANHHSIPGHVFENGHYAWFEFYNDDSIDFSQVQNFYDNGDGTFAAIVDQFISIEVNPSGQIVSINDNGNGTYTATEVIYSEGKSRQWTAKDVRLELEWRAIIKPVYEEGNKRYILLDYRLMRRFTYVQDNWIHYLSKDQGIIAN